MNAYEIAVVCETAVTLSLIGAGTYLGHQFLSRLAAPKQAAAGRNGARTTTTAVTETAPASKPPMTSLPPASVPPLTAMPPNALESQDTPAGEAGT